MRKRHGGEAALTVLGLSEGDPEAWRHVADLYVWGSFHELPAAGADFAATPVEVELSLWDGVNPVVLIKEKATVAQLPALARQLANRCLDGARRTPAVCADAAALCGKIVQSLVGQGKRLEAALASHGVMQRAAFLRTPEGHRLRRQQQLLFAAACFFSPLDRDAQLGRLQAFWDNFPVAQQRLPLLDLWQRSNDLADYAQRFGGADPELAQANVDADAFMLRWLDYGESQIHVSGSEPNLPIDATDADLKAWHVLLDARFMRDALAYAKTVVPVDSPVDVAINYAYATWMAAALQLMHDPAEAARVVEVVWPRYQAFYRQNAAQEDQRYGIDTGLVPAVKRLYDTLHQPARAQTILGALSTGAPAVPGPVVATATVPTVIQLPRLPTLVPVTRSLHFPAGTPPRENAMPWMQHAQEYVVQNLAVGSDEILWISTFRGEDDLSRPLDDQMQAVWRFDPADDSLQAFPVQGLARQTPVTSLLPQSGDLWLTIGLNGVWHYDSEQTQSAHQYTVADGLLTANMDSSVHTADGQWYFAGHENGLPLLNRFDATGRNWLRIELPISEEHSTMTPAVALGAAPLTQLCTSGHWLLVRLGESWTLLDTRNHRTQSLREALPQALREKIASFAETVPHPIMAPDRLPLPRPWPCTGDARGFWFAVDGKIIRFDPEQPQATRCWSLPDELTDGVTALAADGEDLWMAGPAGMRHAVPTGGAGGWAGFPRLGHNGKGFVAVLHEVDGQWRGSFELPAPVGRIAASRQTVYVDQQMVAQPILEIDKDATLSPHAH